MATQVGAAYISVVPDLSGFHKKIAAELGKIGAQAGKSFSESFRKAAGDPTRGMADSATTSAAKSGEQAGGAFATSFKKRLEAAFKSLPDAEIDADATPADRKLGELRERMRQLGEKTIGVDVDATSALAELASIKRELAALNDGATVDVRADIASATVQLDAIQAQVDKLDAEKVDVKVDVDKTAATRIGEVDRSLKALGSSARATSKMLSKGLKFSLLGGGLITLAGGAAAAAASVVKFAAALVPIGGLVAGIPALVGGAAIAFGTLKLAVTGVGDAFGAALGDDPKKFQESLEGLAPAAQVVAKELHAVRPQLLGIKNAAQGALFAPLRGQITSVVQTLAGPLRIGVAQVGAQFGAAAVQVAKFARESKTVQALKTGFSGVAASIHSLSPAIQPLLAGFRDLAVAIAPVLQGIVQSLGKAAAKFGAWMQQMAASGQATEFFNNALTVVKQLGSVLASVGGIITSVLSAATTAGGDFLSLMGDALESLNQFFKSAQGQNALISIFQGLAAIGKALSPVIQALAKAIGVLAAPIARLAIQLGPILTKAITALAPALTKLEPGLAAIFSALGGVVDALAPVLPIVGQALSQLVVALAPLLPILARVVAALVRGLAPIITALMPLISLLVGVIGTIAAAITPLLPVLGRLIGQFVSQLMPVLTPIITMLGQVAAQIIGTLLQAFIQIMPSLTLIVSAIASLLPAITPLIPLIAQLALAFVPLIPPIVQLVAQMVTLLVPILKVLITVIVKVASFLLSLLIPVIKFLVTVISAVVKAITWFVKNVLAPVFHWLYAKVIKPVWNAIQVAISWAWNNVIKPVWNAIKWYITNVLAPIFRWIYNKVIKPIWQGIGVAISLVWNKIIKPVWNLIRWYISKVLGPLFRWLYNKVIHPIWNAIGTIIRWTWNNVIKPVWNLIKWYIDKVLAPVFRWIYNNVIKPIWKGIGVTISWVWNKVIKPTFNALKRGVNLVHTAFTRAVNGIKRIWSTLKKAAQNPVKFIVNTVYHGHLRPMVNGLLGKLGLGKWKLPDFRYAEGGIMPGYTPGRDVHQFVSPTAGRLALSGGEAIMRPEVTRTLGADRVNRINAAARSGGTAGVRRELGFASGGIYPGPRHAYAGGGVVDWLTGKVGGIWDTVTGAGKSVLNKIKDVAFAGGRALFDTVYKASGVQGWVNHLTDSGAFNGIPGGGIELAVKAIRSFLDTHGGGNAADVIRVANSYVGKVGEPNNRFQRDFGMPNAAWCAMFISDVFKEAGAGKAVPRSAAVASFNSALPRRKGKPVPGDLLTYRGAGHINLYAGGRTTIGGNESDGVRKGTGHYGTQTATLVPKWGKVARGGKIGKSAAAAQKYAREQMAERFGWSVGYNWGPLRALWNRESGWRWNARNPSSGAYGIPQALPPTKMASAGPNWRSNAATQVNWGLGYIHNRYGNPASAWRHEQNIGWYDRGGWLKPGVNQVVNATGKPEAVLTPAQSKALVAMVKGGGAQVVEYHSHFDGMTKAAYEQQVRTAHHAMGVEAAMRNRVGRRG